MSRSSIFSMALEGEPPAAAEPQEATKQPSIEMKGPLSEIYRKALDIAFAKKDTVSGEATVGQADDTSAVPAGEKTELALATESQANDALTLAHMRSLMADTSSGETEEDGEPSALLTVYGVSDGELSEDTVVDLTKELAAKPAERDFVLILDSTQSVTTGGNANSGVDERFVGLGRALEQMVLAHKGRVYRSLQAAAEGITKL